MTDQFNEAIDFLRTKSGVLTGQTQRDLRDGKLQLRDSSIVVRKKLSGGAGIVKILTSSDQKKNGEISISNGKLEAGVNQVVSAIRLGYANATTASAKKAGQLTYANTQSGAPTALLNADLIVTQGGRNVVEIPCAKFFTAASATEVGERFAPLDALALLKEDEPIEVHIQFPEDPDALSSGNDHFVEVILDGLATSRRA